MIIYRPYMIIYGPYMITYGPYTSIYGPHMVQDMYGHIGVRVFRLVPSPNGSCIVPLPPLLVVVVDETVEHSLYVRTRKHI